MKTEECPRLVAHRLVLAWSAHKLKRLRLQVAELRLRCYEDELLDSNVVAVELERYDEVIHAVIESLSTTNPKLARAPECDTEHVSPSRPANHPLFIDPTQSNPTSQRDGDLFDTETTE